MVRAWIVNQAHHVAVVGGYVSLGEIERSQLAIAVKLAIAVAPLPVQDGRRVAEMNAEDTIDRFQSVHLRLAHRIGACLVLVEAANFGRALSNLVVEHGVHLARAAGTLGLGHGLFGNHAVLIHQVDEHIPLTGVLDGGEHQVLDNAVVNGPVSGLDNRLQDEVCALHLIPEHHVVLAELELAHIQRLHGVHTEQVQAAEKPASS